MEASFGDVPLQRPAAIATSTLPVPLQGLDPEGKHGRIGFVTTNECAAEDLRQLTEVNRVCAGEPVVVTYDPRSAETPEKVRADSKSLSGLIVNAYLPSFSRALALASRQRDMVRNSDYPDGFPWLMGYHLRRAQEGNSTRDTALEACRAADEEGIPWIVYAPEKSTKREAKGIPASIWDCDKAVALAGGPGRKHGAVYMCSFGWCAAGPTRLLACRTHINPPARPGCPLWDEAGGYGGPLPPWCGHRHNKSRHAMADRHFPRACVRLFAQNAPKGRVSGQDAYGRGKEVPAWTTARGIPGRAPYPGARPAGLATPGQRWLSGRHARARSSGRAPYLGAWPAGSATPGQRWLSGRHDRAGGPLYTYGSRRGGCADRRGFCERLAGGRGLPRAHYATTGTRGTR